MHLHLSLGLGLGSGLGLGLGLGLGVRVGVLHEAHAARGEGAAQAELKAHLATARRT